MRPRPPEFQFELQTNGSMTVGGTGRGAGGREPVDDDTRYFVDEQPLTEALSRYVSREQADLLDVAVAVYLADRLAKRTAGSRKTPGEHHWQRTMHVRIPVRNLSRWHDAAMQEALRRALGFLTDDDWQIEFAQRPPSAARVSEGVQFLFAEPIEQPARVALFSGGLDSLAGLARDLEADRCDNASHTIVLVSANTNPRILPLQRCLIQELRQRTDRKIIWTVGQFGLRRRKRRQYEQEERTQRTRGFAFTALGAVAALACDASSLALYENGVGAINLPYTEWQLGAQSTRAMHPTFLAFMQRVVELACGKPLTLDLRALTNTKGELCQALAASQLVALSARTISCDGFPQRTEGAKQCGTCTSCLFRRQALLVAGVADDERSEFGYRTDVYRWYRTMSKDKRLAPDLLFDQARRIRGAGGDWDALVREFPMLIELPDTIVHSAARRDAIAAMYDRYGRECEQFERAVRQRELPGAVRRFA